MDTEHKEKFDSALQALRANLTNHIYLFCIEFNHAVSSAFCKELKRNVSVTELFFHSCHIDDSIVLLLVDALLYKRKLTEKNLKQCNSGSSVVNSISRSLELNSTLATIILENNNIGDCGAQYLEEALMHNTNLTTLDLRYNYIKDKGAQALAMFLKGNKCLDDLNLNHNFIEDTGAQALALALTHNTSLTTLSLGYNQCGDTCAQAFAMVLKHNTSLIKLDLCHNRIRVAGVKSLAEALFHNNSLKTLDLDSNRVCAVGSSALASALQSNYSLVEIGVGLEYIYNLAPEAWDATLFSRLTDLTTRNIDATLCLVIDFCWPKHLKELPLLRMLLPVALCKQGSIRITHNAVDYLRQVNQQSLVFWDHRLHHFVPELHLVINASLKSVRRRANPRRRSHLPYMPLEIWPIIFSFLHLE